MALEAATAYRRLTRLAKDDADRVRQIMAALDLGDWDALAAEVQDRLLEVFAAGGEAALVDALGRAAAQPLFGGLNPAAVDYASKRGAELVTQVLGSTREGLRDLVTSAFEDGLSPVELADAIRESYWFGADRADMIARTELSMAHVQGSLEGWRDSGVVAGKSVLLSADHDVEDECDENADEGVIPIDEEFQDGDPPFHPNCNCTLVPELIEGYEEEAA